MTDAAQINAAARRTAHAGYGGNAYISDVAEALGMTVEALAPALHRCRQEGSVELVRADLVRAMDGTKVQKSEVNHPMLRTASWHFVVPR